MKVKLDRAGIREVLNSEPVGSAVAALANGVADAARGDGAVQRNGVPVKVDRYSTDRAAASVTLAHAAGLPIEAKHGTLARAAGSQGLEVRSK